MLKDKKRRIERLRGRQHMDNAVRSSSKRSHRMADVDISKFFEDSFNRHKRLFKKLEKL